MKVNVVPDSYFRRDGFDIYTDYYLNVSEAALGGNIKLKTLYGNIDLKIEKGTQDGSKKKLNNYVITKKVCVFNGIIGSNKISTKSEPKRKPLCDIQTCCPKDFNSGTRDFV